MGSLKPARCLSRSDGGRACQLRHAWAASCPIPGASHSGTKRRCVLATQFVSLSRAFRGARTRVGGLVARVRKQREQKNRASRHRVCPAGLRWACRRVSGASCACAAAAAAGRGANGGANVRGKVQVAGARSTSMYLQHGTLPTFVLASPMGLVGTSRPRCLLQWKLNGSRR